jgi:hypothetical protein
MGSWLCLCYWSTHKMHAFTSQWASQGCCACSPYLSHSALRSSTGSWAPSQGIRAWLTHHSYATAVSSLPTSVYLFCILGKFPSSSPCPCPAWLVSTSKLPVSLWDQELRQNLKGLSAGGCLLSTLLVTGQSLFWKGNLSSALQHLSHNYKWKY